MTSIHHYKGTRNTPVVNNYYTLIGDEFSFHNRSFINEVSSIWSPRHNHRYKLHYYLVPDQGKYISFLDHSVTKVIVFITLILINSIGSFDHGALPAVLSDIHQEIHAGYLIQALLASLVYLGLVIGIIITGNLILFVRSTNKIRIFKITFID